MSLTRFLENPGIQRYPRNEQEWRHWINEVAKWIADQDTVTANTTAAAAASAAATAAARTSVYAISNPGGYVWRSDSAGTFPAGDPSFDITTTFYDQSNTQVGQQVLRGSLVTASGIIGVTDPGTSDSPSTGYSVAYATVNDLSDSVRADISLTMPDSSVMTVSVSWNAMDLSVAGGTPATGGGK